ncbi:hypothetical protein RFI_16145, partial [Reticulomyxa filosa]
PPPPPPKKKKKKKKSSKGVVCFVDLDDTLDDVPPALALAVDYETKMAAQEHEIANANMRDERYTPPNYNIPIVMDLPEGIAPVLPSQDKAMPDTEVAATVAITAIAIATTATTATTTTNAITIAASAAATFAPMNTDKGMNGSLNGNDRDDEMDTRGFVKLEIFTELEDTKNETTQELHTQLELPGSVRPSFGATGDKLVNLSVIGSDDLPDGEDRFMRHHYAPSLPPQLSTTSDIPNLSFKDSLKNSMQFFFFFCLF